MKINSFIKDFYTLAYESDEDMFELLNEESTFLDLFGALHDKDNVYEVIFMNGASDSVVRERCFERLSKILNVEYKVIYDMWLK